MSKSNTTLNILQTVTVSRKQQAANRNHWSPNTDVYVTEDSLVVKVELAGMRREDLELSIDGNRLHIVGQRPDGCRNAKCTFLVMEINYGTFECVIDVPDQYDLTQAQASYHNGFLRVDVPQVARKSSKNVIVVEEAKPVA